MLLAAYGTSSGNFYAFSKIRARMYFLERTDVSALPSAEKLLQETSATYNALVQHEAARKKVSWSSTLGQGQAIAFCTGN